MGSQGQVQRSPSLGDSSHQSIRTTEGGSTSTPFKGAEFVVKLFAILEDMKEQYGDIISWSEDGKSFAIHDISKFTEQVLPTIYKHRNLSSFVRQLNKYSFHKVKASETGFIWPNTWAYRHEHFHSSGRDDLENVKRQIPDRKVNQESTEVRHRSPQSSVNLTDDNTNIISQGELISMLDQIRTLTNKLADTEARLAQVERQLALYNGTGQLDSESSRTDSVCAESVADLPSETNEERDPSKSNPRNVDVLEEVALVRPSSGSIIPLQQPETFTAVPASTPTNGTEQPVNPSGDATSFNAMFPVQSIQQAVWTSDSTNAVPLERLPLGGSLNSSDFPSEPNPTSFRDIFFSQFGGLEDDADQLCPSSSNKVSWNSFFASVNNSSGAAAVQHLVEYPQNPPHTLSQDTRHVPHVLLVGDSASEVESCSTLLKYHGCQVDEVLRDHALVSFMRSTIFDFILMDCADPIPLTCLIRSIDTVTPIVCSSTTANNSSLQAQGINDVIAKPVTKSGLLEIIKKYIPFYQLPASNRYLDNPPFYSTTDRMDEDHWDQINGRRNIAEQDSDPVRRQPTAQKRTGIEVNNFGQQQKRVRYS